MKLKYGICISQDIMAEKAGLIVKASERMQYQQLLSMKEICDTQCKVIPHKIYNASKGLIYDDYDISTQIC